MASLAGPGPDAPSRVASRRRQVTDTARKLFVEQGFHATGMAQIAKLSGIAVGQIYRDFSSKDDIVAALVEVDCSRLMMVEALETAIRHDDTDSVRAWLRDFVKPSDDPDDARLFAEILAESARSERIAAIFRDLQNKLRRHVLAALGVLAPSPALAPRRAVVADVILTLSIGVVHQQLTRAKADLGNVVFAVQAVLERELAWLSGSTSERSDAFVPTDLQ